MNVQPSETSVRHVRRPSKSDHVPDDAIREAMAAVGYIGRAASLVGITERQMALRVRRLGIERPGRGRPKGSRPVACETGGETCSGCGVARCWTREGGQ